MALASIAAVERYFSALRDRNLADVPFAANVVFEGPLSPKLHGVEAVKEFLHSILPVIKDVRLHRHVADGEYVATVFDLETAFGVVPVCDTFRVVNGQLTDIRAFYDPRPILEAMARQRAESPA